MIAQLTFDPDNGDRCWQVDFEALATNWYTSAELIALKRLLATVTEAELYDKVITGNTEPLTAQEIMDREA